MWKCVKVVEYRPNKISGTSPERERDVWDVTRELEIVNDENSTIYRNVSKTDK